jgi:nicotinate phosphoribosyltransferase
VSPRRRKRLDPSVFNFPIDQIRGGFYTDIYFRRAREVLQKDGRSPKVMMQVSGKKRGWLSGIDESIALLKLCADDWSVLSVHALFEGDQYEPWDTVLTIEGPYESFAHLETLYLGILSRRTKICTNARHIVEAADSKPVILMGAREDFFLTQPGDGFSAHVGGIRMVSTEAQASPFGGKAVGTIPHALIAAYRGDTVKATQKFVETVGEDVQIMALVDYDNDSVKTSLEVARALQDRLWGVRLDTSENMVDKSIVTQMGAFRPTGVSPQLVWNVRDALDAEGFGHVKIIVSGGFDVERIKAFEEDGVPVDAYGVGAAVYEGQFDFTADIVQLEGKPESKKGRGQRTNDKLERVK